MLADAPLLRPADSSGRDALTAVLPIRVGAERISDLDRVERLLFPSFELYWRRPDQLAFLVIVPPADLCAVAARLGRTNDFLLQVVSEDALCPSLAGKGGWHKQQLVKLAAAAAVPTPWYMTLDADVILRRPTSLHDLFPDGKAAFRQEAAWHHWDWWEASSAILQTRLPFDRDGRVMAATPEILSREVVLDLLAELARRNHTDRPEHFLFEARGSGWTEYSLYWLYVLERQLERRLYSWAHPVFSDGIWVPEQLTDPGYLARLFSPECEAFFLVLQSNLGLPLGEIERLIRPYIPLKSHRRRWITRARDWVARQTQNIVPWFR